MTSEPNTVSAFPIFRFDVDPNSYPRLRSIEFVWCNVGDRVIVRYEDANIDGSERTEYWKYATVTKAVDIEPCEYGTRLYVYKADEGEWNERAM